MHPILHADADAFFASVEQASDPRLRGKPMAVGGERRGIIASASYEARKFGIYTPMPTMRARKLCPQLIVVSGDYEKYERFSRWMFSYAYDFTPQVEITSIDEGYFDLYGSRKPPLEVANTLAEVIHRNLKITVSEGLASNKLLSQVASKLNKPNNFIHVPFGTEREFLAPLRTHWLPGIGPKTQSRLDAAGLTHIRQLAITPVDHLRLLLGKGAPTIREFANGIDERPVEASKPEAKTYGQQRTWEQDQTDPTRLEAELRRMADELMTRVRRDQKMIRTVTVHVRYNDMGRDQAGESLDEPSDLEDDIYSKIRPLLRKAWRRRVAVRQVTLRLSRVYRGAKQFELNFDPLATNYKQRKRLADTVDRLREDGGRYTVMRGHDLLLRQKTAEAEAGKAPPPKPATPPLRHQHPAPASCTYVPLRVHSHYSMMDSTLSVIDLVTLARKYRCPALALTDRANLHGAVPFHQACRAAGIQPIIGCSFERPDGRTLILLAENQAGYAALCRRVSDPTGDPLKDTAPPTDPAGLRTGLIAISDDPSLAAEFPGTFYRFRDLALPEIRYGAPPDRTHYNIVQSIRTLSMLDHEHPDKRDGDYHFLAPDDVARHYTPEQIQRTHEIAARCQFSFTYNQLHFPGFKTPPNETANEMLARLVLIGATERYPTRPGHTALADVRPQLEQELAMIAEVGYAEYFLVVWDILQRCKALGIEWITRGSAADSLVCYCLRISDVCPIRFKLYFRRFLNRERMQRNKLPDIDIDFPHDRKDEVVDLMFATFGESHTAVVGGFSTFRARSALGDIAKVLGVSEHQIRRITERLPRASASNLADIRDSHIECKDLPLDEEPYATAVRLAADLDGVPRYPKMHPCGVVVSPRPMHDYTPTFRSAKGYPTTHFDMDAVEDIGLIKIDILAQGGLSVMRDARAMIASNYNRHIDFESLKPWTDPAVWAMISSGQSRGVHHIESPAMISLARMCNTRDIDTLVAQVSVIRPGAANESRKLKYARRYQGLEPVDYPHPSVIPCLEETYGVIAYEEQVMQICELFANLDPGTSDELRRALTKQKVEALDPIGRKFIASARVAGRSKEEIKTVWEFTLGFMGYAFCKAHSAAYAIEAYQAAWLKCHYPAEFMAGVLTHGKGFYRPLVYALECIQLGIRFLPPRVNTPGPGYRATQGRIRVPVRAIKGLSERCVQTLLDERRSHGPFRELADFMGRVRPSRDEGLALLNAGAFDDFAQSASGDGGTRSRAALYWDLQWLFDQAPPDPRDPQVTMLPPSAVPSRPPVELTEPSHTNQLTHEMELVGFAITGHPLDLYPDVPWLTYVQIAELGQYIGRRVVVCGLVIQDRVAQQVNGELMKFMTICDYSGMVETELFAKGYKEYGLNTVRYAVLEVVATVEPFENNRGHTLRIHRCHKPKGLKEA